MLDTLEHRIGARIRCERESRGWSLTDLAERSGVSRAMINKVERAESSPTSALLGRLCGAFGLSMSTLIARAEMREGRLLRRADQPVWTDPQSGFTRRHVSPRSDTPLDLVCIELPPGAELSMPAAAYTFLRQWIWVQSGSLVVIEGALRHEMEEGDCLVLGPPADCVFRNEGLQPCVYCPIILSGVLPAQPAN